MAERCVDRVPAGWASAERRPADEGGRPVILVSPRWVPETPYGLERLAPQQAIADCFVEALIAAGGLPLQMALTTDVGVIDAYLDLADGLALPGGSDVNPRRWGSDMPYDQALLCEARDAFEIPLVRRALERDLPVFGTCRGAQIINVALGGTLCMDVPSLGAPEGMVQWRHEGVLRCAAHPVAVEEGSLLCRAMGGATTAQVNSSHHCCVAALGEGVRLTGCATDGIPEAIEVEGARFCLGVQWHPEYTWRTLETDFGIWRAFVDACRG